MEKILDNRGLCIAGVYHSHANAKAYFSEEDKQRAMLGNEPMWPDAHYLVISVVNCNVLNAKSFAWDYSKRDFVRLIKSISKGTNAYERYLAVKNNLEEKNGIRVEEAEYLNEYLKRLLLEIKDKVQ